MLTSFKRIYVVVIAIAGFTQAQAQITEIITDYNNFWKSGRPVINAVRPDNSHSLLAIKYRNLYYSTGINDATLTANGINFTPGDYRALPVTSVAAPTSGVFIGLGQLYDGVDNGPSNPAPVNNMPFYLTDGLKGLNLGTAVYNLPVSNVRIDVRNIQLPKIGDSIPDIIVTQMGETGASSLDILYFSNSNGDTVGNSVTVRFLGIDTLGLGVFDFYQASQNPMTIATGTSFTKSPRAIRFFAADLSVFGLNSTNIANVDFFTQRLSGTSDIAFVAYNAEAIQLAPDHTPGCFATLPGIWVKANDGTSTITNNSKISLWQDRSVNTFLVEQSTTAMQPQFKNGTNTGFNFNPYLNFDAANSLASANSPFSTSNGNADFFIVGRPTNTTVGNNKVLGFSRTAADNAGNNRGDFPALNFSGTGASVIADGNINLLTGSATSLNAAYIWRTNYTNGSAISFFRNGAADGTGGIASNTGRQSFQVGDALPGDNLSDFDVAEIIAFPQNLTATERNQVETYLAIKYGITLSHNYISGTGTTIWNLATSSAYNNNIFGIGREDCESLHQKQSKSGNLNALVTIGNTSIATENGTNLTTIANASFSLMGDDNGSLNWQTTEKPAKIEQRIGREWKVSETGTIGPLLLRVPAASSTQSTKLPDPANCRMFLLVDNDGNFSSGILAQIEMTLVGTNWEATYNFADGTYYTFATENKDYGDFSLTWPAASASIAGCDVNKDGLYSNADNNGSKVLVWAGASVTAETTASTNNTDGNDDGLQFTMPTFSPGYTYPFQVLLNGNIAGTTVHFRMWYDWNNDGNFANDSSILTGGSTLIPATYAGSSVVNGSVPSFVVVNVKPPFGASSQFKIRLIVSDAPVADMYRSVGPAYQYALTNGEVEDYVAPALLLPVVLKKFVVISQSCTALLQWETAVEVNSRSYTVEQSVDGINFTAVAVIASQNQPSGAAYKFAAGQLPAGPHYYRLKMTDADGNYTYSQVEKVKNTCAGNSIVLSPNPARNDVYINGLPANTQIIVTDATGRLITVQAARAATLHLDVQKWAPGIYTVRVMENGKPGSTYKFVKEK